MKDYRIPEETLRTWQRKPLSAPRSVRAVTVYDHHPPRRFSIGFRDCEPALAHPTARDDASVLVSAERVAVDSSGPERSFTHRFRIHVRLRYRDAPYV